jgi:hypothetical protein
MELSQERSTQPYGLLYPVMLIAAIAVIVFSILGIVSIAGWMPSALSASVSEPRLSRDAGAAVPVSARAGVTFECAECGMIEGIRQFERSGALANLRVETKAPARL